MDSLLAGMLSDGSAAPANVVTVNANCHIELRVSDAAKVSDAEKAGSSPHVDGGRVDHKSDNRNRASGNAQNAIEQAQTFQQASAEDATMQEALDGSLLEMAPSQWLQVITNPDQPQPAISDVPVDVREEVADLDTPSKLRELLLKLGCKHPQLVRDISWTAGSTLKVQYLQACLKEEGGDHGKGRLQELWSLLSVRDQSDLLNAFELGDGDRDTFFLKIAQEDRHMRAKLGEDAQAFSLRPSSILPVQQSQAQENTQTQENIQEKAQTQAQTQTQDEQQSKMETKKEEQERGRQLRRPRLDDQEQQPAREMRRFGYERRRWVDTIVDSGSDIDMDPSAFEYESP